MLNKEKSGRSLILLVIVISVMSVILLFVSRIFNNKENYKAEEEAFKLNVYEYYLKIEDYKEQRLSADDYNEADFNVCGVELKSVIPDIIETDMSKFKIEQGKLIYIGSDQREEQWTKEVRI